jgi:signal transduction histidine kinase/PAS domain-containing protein/ActR/RegA family two-component response regulator
MKHIMSDGKTPTPMKKAISRAEIEALISRDPGSYAIYKVHSANQIETLFYSPDRPSFCGYSKEEYDALAKEASSLVLKEDRPLLNPIINKALATGEDVELNYRVLHKSLGFVWLHAIYRLIGYEDGSPVFFASLMNSTSETKAFGQILDNVKTIIYVVDCPTHQILYANKAALEYSKKGTNFAGQSCYSFIRGEKKACADCLFTNLPFGKERHNEVYRENQKVWQLISCQRVDWCGHDAMIQSIEDITDYKKLQDKLLQEKNDLEQTVASIPVGLSVFQKIGDEINRISFNSDVSAIKGVKAETLNKESFLDVFQRVLPSDKERVIADTKNVFEKGHTVCIYQTRNEKTGRYMTLRREGRALTQEDGSQLAYFCYIDITAQTEEEEALRLSQERYENAVKGGNIAVWEYSIAEKTLVSSERSLSLLGMPNQLDHIPDSLMAYFSTESQKDVLTQINDLNEGKDPAPADLWLLNHGNPRCVKVSYSLIKDASGKPLKAYGVAQDITLQKQIEAQYARLSMDFLSFNPGALCSFRLNLTKDTCAGGHGSSDYIKKVLSSKTASGFFTQLFTLITNPDDLSKAKELLSVDKLLSAFHKDKKNFSLTYRRQMEKGDRHWVTTYIALVQNPQTQDIEALLYSVDSNDEVIERLIDERLSDENYEFTALIDPFTKKISFRSVPVKDGTTPIRYENFDDDFANACDCIMNPEDAEKSKKAVNVAAVVAALAKAPRFTYPFTITKGPGTGKTKLLTFSYLDASHDEILLARSDVSATLSEEKRQAQILQDALQEAKKANQLKTDFLSNVSHDMRTPLNGVIGYTNMALESNDLEQIKDDLKKIKKSGELLMSLINDTLDLSKIETGQISLQRTPMALEELVTRITTAIAPSVDEKKLHFDVDTSKSYLGVVNIDVLKMTEIINNLLSNAVKFTPENGHVRLALTTLKDKPEQIIEQIIVEDDGVGMSDGFISKAFEPFSQERTKANASVAGSGLGLSIVRQLVHLAGGDVSLESAIGKGTKITVVMPLEKLENDDNSKSKVVLDPSVLKGKTVLLVEDNWMNTEIAKNILMKNGLVVECAANGAEACNSFLNSPIDHYAAILMDIRMPIMNGFEAAKSIRKAEREDAKRVPIIAMTADAYEDDIKRCIDAGMNSHIAKPIDQRLLLQELARLITE